MASWVSWLVLVVIAVALGVAANHFSVRTVRWFTAVITVGLIVAVTTYGLGHPAPTAARPALATTTPMTAPTPPDLETAFARGADGIAAALFRPLWLGHQVPEPGRVGWLVILVLLALGYRQLESWAYRKQAPVLDTSHLTDAQPGIPDGNASSRPRDQRHDKRHDQLAAELQFRVAAMDVRSPSILPGGSRSNGLASIAEASGVQGGNLVGAIIQFFGQLWPGPRRWQLRVWVERPADMRITVELDDPRTGLTMAAKTLNVTGLNAASMIAGYVGRHVFASDPTSPPWCYGAADGNDLGAMLIARQQRVNAESSEAVQEARRKQIQGLQAVTRQSKCAGVVRYELASLQDLEQDHYTALRQHALNREQYPRFFRGRYRLAMSLEMATEPSLTFSNQKDARDTLTGIITALNRCGLTRTANCTDCDIVKPDGDHGPYRISDALGLDLLKFAVGELQVLQRQLRLPVILWAALRHRDERTVWRPHRGLRVRQAFRDGACVAELLVAVRIIQIIQTPQIADIAQKDIAEIALKDRALRRTLRLSHFRHALRITAAIAGDNAPIEALFREAWRARQPARQPAATAGSSDFLEAALDQALGTGQPARQPTATAATAGDGASLVAVLDRAPSTGECASQPAATAATAGDSAPIEAELDEAPHTGQPAGKPAATAERARLLPWLRRIARQPDATAERVRLLPWLRRTASWQAAYNTACIYSALAQREVKQKDRELWERRVVASLQRAIHSRDSEMERPYDWIACDPAFLPLQSPDSVKYPAFARFLLDQKSRDYPRSSPDRQWRRAP